MKTSLLFETLASITWGSIKSSHNNRIHLGEDAITTYILNAIAHTNTNNVLYEDTRSKESIKGCDFELWIGNNRCGWIRYAIQAKKINYPNDRYNALTHKVRGKRQIDILTTYASSNNATPLYCFFNNSNSPVKWHCKETKDVVQLGISVAPIATVDLAIKNRGCKNFSFIHNKNKSLPWRCLVKCPSLSPCMLKKNNNKSFFGSEIINELPHSLEILREKKNTEEHNGENIENYSMLNNDEALFSSESKYRPKRIAIIETDDGNK